MKFFTRKNVPCPYCGNNPVNHYLTYLTQSFSVALTPPRYVRAFVGGRFMRHIERSLLRGSHRLFSLFGLVTYHTDISQALSERSRVIWEEAVRRGLRMEQAYFSDKPTELYRVYMRGNWEYFLSIPTPFRLITEAALWIDDKAKVKKALEMEGMRVPQGGEVSSFARALKIFNAVTKPVIVKPAIGSRGRHTITLIHTEKELQKGFSIAQQLCRSVVVEEHLVGSVYRVTYVGGEIGGVLSAEPPRVTGDGVSTVRVLIEHKDAHRHQRQSPVPLHEGVHDFLVRQGYTFDSVLENGVTIDLTEKIGLGYGGTSREILHEAHPVFLEVMRRAGSILNAPIIGFDVISEDVTKHPDTVRWGIIEANSMPFIDLHHYPLYGEPENVASMVWDLWGIV